MIREEILADREFLTGCRVRLNVVVLVEDKVVELRRTHPRWGPPHVNLIDGEKIWELVEQRSMGLLHTTFIDAALFDRFD
jgi:hypothetical protein